MFKVFGGLKSFVKTKKIRIEDEIWKLHYRFTVILLIACSVIVTSKQYIGDPINCLTTADVMRVANSFCWIQTTFTLPGLLTGNIGSEVAHPGIAKSVNMEDRKYHTYYQWVCFVLFFQAVFFYLPRYIWKTLEKGRMENLVSGLNAILVTEEEADKRRRLLVNYLHKSMKKHKYYTMCYFACEMLYLLNVTLQIWLMDWFLEGEFSRYGIEVAQFLSNDQSGRVDPMIKVFPRVTKCTFHRFGPSGDVQKHDILCVLPLNIVNEKAYVFFWFWFVILSCLSGFWILCRIPTIFSRRIRAKLLYLSNRAVLEDNIHYILRNGGVGDWLILTMLCWNVPSMQYVDIINKLAANNYSSTKLESDDETKSKPS